MVGDLPGGVELLDIDVLPGKGGEIIVAEEGSSIPFPIKRVFVVRQSAADSMRGDHAHRTCAQVMICLVGQVDITLDDGERQKTVVLSSPATGLKVPPLVWTSQCYRGSGSVLMVLCDEGFSEQEYIRDYDAFIACREGR